MNIRHAAALAVVGWYLMVPPLYQQGINPNASVSEWERRQAFDTADDCETARRALINCGEILNGGKPGNVMAACGFLKGMPARSRTKHRTPLSVNSQCKTWKPGASRLMIPV